MVDRLLGYIDAKDLEILSYIAKNGESTRYDIVPHGKTNRKSPIKKLAPSSAKLRLETLERNGYLYSTQESTGLQKRLYSLTIRGFLCFLANRRFDKNKETIKKAVDRWGTNVRYRISRYEPTKKRPIIESKPIFLLSYHQTLRKDLGDAAYFESLIHAAFHAYKNIGKIEESQRIFHRTDRGEQDKIWLSEYRQRLLKKRIPPHDEEQVVYNFGIAFLDDIFGRSREGLADVVPFQTRHTNKEIHDEVKKLLNRELSGLNERTNHVKSIKEKSLRHFDPDVKKEDLKEEEE